MDAMKEANYKFVVGMMKPGLNMMIDNSISNPQNVPDDGPGIIVANHRSDIDPFLIMMNVRRPINFLAAQYLYNIPFLGPFFNSIGGIPVSKYRSDIVKAFDRAADCLRNGELVGVFPEGWNYIAENQFNWSVGEFQTGFARIAFQTGAPVIPMALLGLNEKRGFQSFSPWIRKILDYPVELQYAEGRVVYRKLHINVGKPIPVPDGADPDDRESVKAFANKVNEAVRKLYGEIPGAVIRFEGQEPLTAVPGIGKPLEEDVFAKDIVEAVKAIRRAARTEDFVLDEQVLETLKPYPRKLKKLTESEDRNVREMAEHYIGWIKKIKAAAKKQSKIEEKFAPFVKKYS